MTRQTTSLSLVLFLLCAALLRSPLQATQESTLILEIAPGTRLADFSEDPRIPRGLSVTVSPRRGTYAEMAYAPHPAFWRAGIDRMKLQSESTSETLWLVLVAADRFLIDGSWIDFETPDATVFDLPASWSLVDDGAGLEITEGGTQSSHRLQAELTAEDGIIRHQPPYGSLRVPGEEGGDGGEQEKGGYVETEVTLPPGHANPATMLATIFRVHEIGRVELRIGDGLIEVRAVVENPTFLGSCPFPCATDWQPIEQDVRYRMDIRAGYEVFGIFAQDSRFAFELTSETGATTYQQILGELGPLSPGVTVEAGVFNAQSARHGWILFDDLGGWSAWFRTEVPMPLWDDFKTRDLLPHWSPEGEALASLFTRDGIKTSIAFDIAASAVRANARSQIYDYSPTSADHTRLLIDVVDPGLLSSGDLYSLIDSTEVEGSPSMNRPFDVVIQQFADGPKLFLRTWDDAGNLHRSPWINAPSQEPFTVAVEWFSGDGTGHAGLAVDGLSYSIEGLSNGNRRLEGIGVGVARIGFGKSSLEHSASKRLATIDRVVIAR